MTTDEMKQKREVQLKDAFVLDGVSYRCSAVNPLPVNRMGGVLMDLGSPDTISSEGTTNVIVMPENKNLASMVFAVFDINKYVHPIEHEPIAVGIYRVGEPEPIHYGEYDSFKDDLLDMIQEEPEPGKYIMALGNIAPYDQQMEKFGKAGHFYIFRFRMLEHGSHVQHPTLLGANIDNDLLVNLMFHYEKDVELEHLTCECYDSDFRQVTHTQTMVCLDAYSNSVSVKLQKRVWWMDGDYHLIVYHNHEPFAHVRFITHDGESDVVWEDTLSHDDIFYKLCKDVKKTGKKDMFCLLNGCGKLKKKVAVYQCTPHTFVNEHLMFAATGQPEYDVMNTMTGILHPTYGYQAVTVKELMKEIISVSDEQETLDAKLARRSTVIYGLTDLTAPENEWFARLLLQVAVDRHGFIVLYGTHQELKRLLDMYPEWVNYMMAPSWWNVYNYTPMDGLRTVEHILKKKNIYNHPSTCDKIEEVIQNNWDTLKSWGKADYELWVESEIMVNIKKRLLSDNSFSEIFLRTLLDEDVTLTIRKEKTQENFGYSLKGLERMVGLTDVKEHLKLLFKRMDFDRKREKLGLKRLQTGRPHMVFTGNPGTGKTTVAKMVGQAFKHLGYLSKGEVITIERAQMIGRHIGATEARMTELLKKAQGNVLFIDEAYSLCDNNEGDRKDYGCRALECLLPMLADANSDIIVILAGYEKEMNEMMNLNPGMKGRFPYWFKFEDYDANELHEIATRLLNDNDYTMTESASKILKTCIDEALKVKDKYFHNARWIHQLVEDGLLAMMAERLYDTEPTDTNIGLFRTVTEKDVLRGYERMRSDKNRPPVRKVGFR